MWGALKGLGFAGGAVIEPGAGMGVFASAAPDDLEERLDMTLIERDPTTARLCARLMSDPAARPAGAHVRVVAADMGQWAPERSFDAAVGNVPFSRTSPPAAEGCEHLERCIPAGRTRGLRHPGENILDKAT